MYRALVLSTALTCAAAVTAAPAFAQAPASTAPAAAAPAAGALTPADAATFMGDWTLAMESPMGPSAIALSVKEEAGKVVGEISSDMQPKTPITDVSKIAGNLVMGYTFMYEGNPVPVSVTLAPAADGKVNATLDFGGGAFLMTGTATKAAK